MVFAVAVVACGLCHLLCANRASACVVSETVRVSAGSQGVEQWRHYLENVHLEQIHILSLE